MRYYLKEKNIVALYYVFFHTYLQYGILGWRSATKTILHPLQILQNKVMRIINRTTAEDHVKNNALYQKLKFLKIDDVYKLELRKFLYLYHVNDLPEIFETYFLSIDHAHHYNTRSKSNANYFVNSVRTNSGKNSIKFLGARLWNQIESQLKLNSYYRFKKEHTKLLLGCYN